MKTKPTIKFSQNLAVDQVIIVIQSLNVLNVKSLNTHPTNSHMCISFQQYQIGTPNCYIRNVICTKFLGWYKLWPLVLDRHPIRFPPNLLSRQIYWTNFLDQCHFAFYTYWRWRPLIQAKRPKGAPTLLPEKDSISHWPSTREALKTVTIQTFVEDSINHHEQTGIVPTPRTHLFHLAASQLSHIGSKSIIDRQPALFQVTKQYLSESPSAKNLCFLHPPTSTET